jgi:hypothetical protein
MTEDSASTDRQLGRLDGRMASMETKVDAMALDVKELLARDARRQGAEMASAAHETRQGERGSRWALWASGLVGAIGATLGQAGGHRLGWF